MATSPFVFVDAVKSQERLRLALDGITGGGKTWTSLVIGCYLAEREGGVPAVIDSERSSAKKYASYFKFKHLTLPDFDPHTYIGAIEAAIAEKFPVIIIDSFSHAWEGTLDMKDRVTRRSTSKDGYGAWREVTPVHNRLVDLVLRAPAHVIVTMRSKMEYIVDTTPDGKKITGVRKVGLRPVQREGVEYEFDIVGDMDQENTLTITKTRCHVLTGAVVQKPGANLAKTIAEWLDEGEPAIEPEDAALIVAAFDAIPEVEGRRIQAKRDFVARFGRPEQLVASQKDVALAWVTKLAEVEGFPAPQPEVESGLDPTTGTTIPTPAPTTTSSSSTEATATGSPEYQWQMLGFTDQAEMVKAHNEVAEALSDIEAAFRGPVREWMTEHGYAASMRPAIKAEHVGPFFKVVGTAFANQCAAKEPEPTDPLAAATAKVEAMSDIEVVTGLTEREIPSTGNKAARKLKLVQAIAHELTRDDGSSGATEGNPGTLGESPAHDDPSAPDTPTEARSSTSDEQSESVGALSDDQAPF